MAEPGAGAPRALPNLRYYHHFFFFSSRRRHTRCSRDWSSDVCSSDLFSISSTPVCAASRRNAGHSSAQIPRITSLCERSPSCLSHPCSPVCSPPSITITRSEEHTSELQSRLHLVCRLLLEKKKKKLHT